MIDPVTDSIHGQLCFKITDNPFVTESLRKPSSIVNGHFIGHRMAKWYIMKKARMGVAEMQEMKIMWLKTDLGLRPH